MSALFLITISGCEQIPTTSDNPPETTAGARTCKISSNKQPKGFCYDDNAEANEATDSQRTICMCVKPVASSVGDCNAILDPGNCEATLWVEGFGWILDCGLTVCAAAPDEWPPPPPDDPDWTDPNDCDDPTGFDCGGTGGGDSDGCDAKAKCVLDKLFEGETYTLSETIVKFADESVNINLVIPTQLVAKIFFSNYSLFFYQLLAILLVKINYKFIYYGKSRIQKRGRTPSQRSPQRC